MKLKSKGPKRRKNLDEELERVRHQIARLVKNRDQVIAGPFTGEVGFELLYWIPFIRWMVREFPGLEERLVVVSRGGAQAWLTGLEVRYVDILELFPPEDFARHRALADKQRRGVAEFEERVLEEVKRHLGVTQAVVLHPSLLYQSYFRFLKINQLAYPLSLKESEHRLEGLTAEYHPIAVPELGPLEGHLPDEFVAVRFYSSASFADEPEGRRFTSAVIRSLCEHTNVVLLGHRFDLDEHRDVRDELPEQVVRVDDLMKPETNLTLQTAVVGRAKAFIGTYGGFSYLAPFLNVPSLSFSMDRGKTHSWHYELAARIFDRPGWGHFVALRYSDLPLVNLVTSGVALDGIPTDAE